MTMTASDFNMYFAGTYVTTKEGNNLAYIQNCEEEDEVVHFEVYTSPEEHSTLSCYLEEIDDYLNLKGFDLKPFSYKGTVYSPYYTTVRGYKDGVNLDRVVFNPVTGSGYNSHRFRDLLVAMFFEPTVSIKDGMKALVNQERDYLSLDKGFLVVADTEEEPINPLSKMSRYAVHGQPDSFKVVTGGGEEFTILDAESTEEFTDIPVNLFSPEEVAFLNKRRSTGWSDNRMPSKLLELCVKYKKEVEKKEDELPPLSIYRTGLKICGVLEPMEEMFRDLPRLTIAVKEIRDEYRKARRNRTRN